MRVVDEDIHVDGVERLRDRGVARRVRARDACDELQVARRLDRSGYGATRPARNAADADASHDNARSRAARSVGAPCVGSTYSTGSASNGRSASAISSRVTPGRSHLSLISSPWPKSTSVSPEITARWLSTQSTVSFVLCTGNTSAPNGNRSPAEYGRASP